MRRNLDFYPTPEWATRELLRHVAISGVVFEPCVGNAAIANAVRNESVCMYTGDLDPHWSPMICGDARQEVFWKNAEEKVDGDYMFRCGIDWVVTNPPFNAAAQIIPLAYKHAVVGIAMLLRLSFLEPVEDRGAWLNEHPPSSLIVLPRISFTNDGKTDSVTCAWMVWEKGKQGTITVAENPKFMSRQIGQNQESIAFT